MSHRLQVLIPEELDLALSQAAARERVSKGAFVRSAIEVALAQRIADTDPVATLASISAPTADIEQMLAERGTRPFAAAVMDINVYAADWLQDHAIQPLGNIWLIGDK